VDGIVDDNYPVPERMLVHLEQVVHDYLIQDKKLTQEICHHRQELLYEGFGLEYRTDKFDAAYYSSN